jgi:hypothetical protein
MTEPIYLAFFIWALVFFSDFIRRAAELSAQPGKSSLTKCGLCIAGACLTRYDGWLLAIVMSAIALLLVVRPTLAPLRPTVAKFILLAATAPTLWLGYNALIYGNPLEFANGPYSAKAIEKRTQMAGNPGHPGSGNPALAALYFLKSAQDNLAQNEWLQRVWIFLALAALIVLTLRICGRLAATLTPATVPLLFLAVPLPFYALSIAYGGVPIFIPNWWPFTHYNTRYGLQLLPAFAVAAAVLVYIALRAGAINYRVRLATVFLIFAVVAISYGGIWQSTPICLKEAQVNMRTRNQLQAEVAKWIEKLPADSTLLMYVGDHVGALQRAAFPLKHTINEGNHRVWRQPTDAEGLWERALADPAKYADYVLAFEGDPVWQAIHDKHLHELIELHVTGQPRAVLYAAR